MGNIGKSLDAGYSWLLVIFVLPVVMIVIGPVMLETMVIAPLLIQPWGWIVLILLDLILIMVLGVIAIGGKNIYFGLSTFSMFLILCLNIYHIFSGYPAPAVQRFGPNSYYDNLVSEHYSKLEVTGRDRINYYNAVWLEEAKKEKRATREEHQLQSSIASLRAKHTIISFLKAVRDRRITRAKSFLVDPSTIAGVERRYLSLDYEGKQNYIKKINRYIEAGLNLSWDVSSITDRTIEVKLNEWNYAGPKAILSFTVLRGGWRMKISAFSGTGFY